MKILLIGEYSNVHWTLAEGLRTLGHEVTVLSNGDFWKDYQRDLSLVRKPTKVGGIYYLLRLYKLLPRLRGYDVVQLINPMFFELKAKRLLTFYHYLRKHNGKVFLCALGMDFYWVNMCSSVMPLRYSDFNIGHVLRTNEEAVNERRDWVGTEKEILNKYIANDCDGIITGLYEYWACYKPNFEQKTTFIPLPIKDQLCIENSGSYSCPQRIRVFIGINKQRNAYKGTDIMLRAAQDLARKYPQRMELVKVESVPYHEYCRIMDGSDAILDQLYSYTPSMNSLLAMSKGIICIGGGEPENYEILNEHTLQPILNVEPNYESVYSVLENFILHPEGVQQMKMDSIAYICKHHDFIKVAQRYVDFYKHCGAI